MAALTVSMERRRAEVNITAYWAARLGLPVGTCSCYVLGLFQSADGDYADPVFVCELDDGRVLTTQVDLVKFVGNVGEVE
jgi:hypothetical protein